MVGLVVVCVPVGSWAYSELIRYDDRLVSVSLPVVLALGALVSTWLRARTAFLVAVVLGGALAAPAAAYLIHDGFVSTTDPYVTVHGNAAAFQLSLMAVGAAAMLVAIAWGTVSGHPHPQPKKDAGKQP